MRQILFRGWSEEKKEFVKGYFCITEINGHKSPSIIVEKAINSPVIPVRADTVGQLLMKDKNGTQMFEGDIVKQHYEVKTSEGKTIKGHHTGTARMTTEGAQLGCLANYDENGNRTKDQPHKNKRIQIRKKRSEVIGNIYEIKREMKA